MTGETPLPPPAFKVLRFDEDYSCLTNPANRTDWFDFDAMRVLPGAVLIALGIGRIALGTGRDTRRDPHPIVHGLWLMTVGAWLIASMAQLFGLTFRTSWPLLLIAGGAFIVARAQEK